jgi:hypothetical protein
MKLSDSLRGIAAGVALAVLAGLVAVPASAQAADASTGPAASMTFQSGTVNVGTQPELTFMTTGAPAGAVVYLQEEGAGQPWHSIGRIRETSGTVRAPADGAGRYEYRLVLASSAGTPIVASTPAALTVTGAGGIVPASPASPAPKAAASGGGCTACKVANHALPWLALVVDPASVWTAITSVLSTVGDVIAAIFGFLGF